MITLLINKNGITVDIDETKIAGTVMADEAGNATFSSFIPASVAGKTMLFQAVQQSSCQVSHLVTHLFE